MADANLSTNEFKLSFRWVVTEVFLLLQGTRQMFHSSKDFATEDKRESNVLVITEVEQKPNCLISFQQGKCQLNKDLL